MIEIVLMIAGLVIGFLISVGWYKRGFSDMERELNSIRERVVIIEKEGQCTRTDLEVIKNRMGYMEAKIDEIHSVLIRPIKPT